MNTFSPSSSTRPRSQVSSEISKTKLEMQAGAKSYHVEFEREGQVLLHITLTEQQSPPALMSTRYSFPDDLKNAARDQYTRLFLDLERKLRSTSEQTRHDAVKDLATLVELRQLKSKSTPNIVADS